MTNISKSINNMWEVAEILKRTYGRPQGQDALLLSGYDSIEIEGGRDFYDLWKKETLDDPEQDSPSEADMQADYFGGPEI